MPEVTIALSVIALSISFISVMLFLSEHRKNKAVIEKQAQETLTKAQVESNRILEDAIKKAQLIIGQAQGEEVKILADSKSLTQKFEQAAEKEFGEDESKLALSYQEHLKKLAQDLNQAQTQYYSYLTFAKKNIDQSGQDNLETVKNQVNALFEHFEQNLSDFLTQTEQKTVSSIDLELRATRELINTYKQEQLKLIDENAVAILEKTLSLVLSKKLSLRDQTDLVYESLEKAKVEEFLV
jgi:hypothetical protein